MIGRIRKRFGQRILANELSTFASQPPEHQIVKIESPRDSRVYLYTAMADVLRDQISDQLSSASTNDLISSGLLAANVALAVGMLLLRASTPQVLQGWWWYRWWYPLPLFGASALLVGMALLPPFGTRKFLDGPQVPTFLQAMVGESLEKQMEGLLRALQVTWNNNDAILRLERRWVSWGILVLVVSTLLSVGMYAWALS